VARHLGLSKTSDGCQVLLQLIGWNKERMPFDNPHWLGFSHLFFADLLNISFQQTFSEIL
jgi:hypothetical protein